MENIIKMENIQTLVKYINENKDKFSIQKLSEHLVANGYAKADVDKAVSIVNGGGAPSQPLSSMSVPPTGKKGKRSLKLLIIGGAVLTTVCFGSYGAYTYFTTNDVVETLLDVNDALYEGNEAVAKKGINKILSLSDEDIKEEPVTEKNAMRMMGAVCKNAQTAPDSPEVRALLKECGLKPKEGLKNCYPRAYGEYYQCKNDTTVCSEAREIEGVDLETFECIKVTKNDIKNPKEARTSHARDKNHIYSYGKILEGPDRASFGVFLDSTYTKDKAHVYYSHKIMEGADPESFELVGGDYTKDKNSVYFKNRKIKGADVATFTFLNDAVSSNHFDEEREYAKDKASIYYSGYKLKDSDPATFEFLDDDKKYSKDKNAAYYKGKYFEEAIDLGSFEVIDGKLGFSKDKNRVYYETYQVRNRSARKKENYYPADPATFELLGEGYAKDKDRIYYRWNTLVYYESGSLYFAHYGTFKFIVDPDYRYVGNAQDKVNCYLAGDVKKPEYCVPKNNK